MSKSEEYQVVAKGIFGAKGELEVGSRHFLSEVPAEMKNKLVKVSDLGKQDNDAELQVATPAAATEPGVRDSVDFSKMTVPELKKYASELDPPVIFEASDRKDDMVAKLSDTKKQESQVDRAALEQSAITLGIQGYEEMDDKQLLDAVEAKLGE